MQKPPFPRASAPLAIIPPMHTFPQVFHNRKITLSLFVGVLLVTAVPAYALDVQPDKSADLNGVHVQHYYTGVSGTFNQAYWFKENTGINTTLGFSIDVSDGVSTTTLATVLGQITNESYAGNQIGTLVVSCLYDFDTMATSTGYTISSTDTIRMNGNSYSTGVFGEVYGTAPSGLMAFGLSYNPDCATLAPDVVATRFDSVTPADGAVYSATTTEITLTATGYIGDDFYDDSIDDQAQVCLSLIKQNFNSVFVGIGLGITGAQRVNYCETFAEDFTGEFSVSTTAPMIGAQEGSYRFEAKIKEPPYLGFLNSGWYINEVRSIAFGQLSSADYWYNDVVNATNDIFNSPANEMEDPQDFCTTANFSIVGCVSYLFIPSQQAIKDWYDSYAGLFLSKPPFGYFTRFTTIMVGGSSVKPPDLEYCFGSSSPEDLQDKCWDVNVFDHFDILTTIKSDQDDVSDIWDVTMPFFNVTVSLAIFLVILSDIAGIQLSGTIGASRPSSRYSTGDTLTLGEKNRLSRPRDLNKDKGEERRRLINQRGRDADREGRSRIL